MTGRVVLLAAAVLWGCDESVDDFAARDEGRAAVEVPAATAVSADPRAGSATALVA